MKDVSINAYYIDAEKAKKDCVCPDTITGVNVILFPKTFFYER